MKIALITDTHWGIRNDSVAFHDNSKKFLDEVFFPYLDEHKIKTVIHLGDVLDRRKYVNINTARRLREDFIEPMLGRALDIHIILGNHDTYFKNTNQVNSPTELLGNFGLRLYSEPTELVFDGTKLLLMPWICDDNRQRALDLIGSTDAQICMGHLEIQGFEMFKGSVVSHGDDPVLFDRFDMVLSGHYHHRSTDGHIFYLGSHMEFTWSDYDDPKGFHIFDTETRELKFVENPNRMFKKIWYDDTDPEFLNQTVDYSEYKGCIVKLIVQNKSNLYWFDKFVEQLESENLHELQIVEDHLNLSLEDDADIVNEAESTLDIFKKYIETFEVRNLNKQKLEYKIVELYNEALTLE